jgi:hypothetical protein
MLVVSAPGTTLMWLLFSLASAGKTSSLLLVQDFGFKWKGSIAMAEVSDLDPILELALMGACDFLAIGGWGR